MTWQQPKAHETRIGYAIFDPIHSQWGLAGTVMPPVAATITGTTMATNISSALHSGRLLLAYQLATVERTTVTADGIQVPNVPVITAHSLRYAEVILGRNLSVSPDDITVTPTTAAPGEPVTISAVIRNTGQLATPPVDVRLRQDAVPCEIATQTIGGLVAGEVMTVTFTHTQPVTQATALSVEVNPGVGVDETTRADNTAAVPILHRTIALPTIYTPPGVEVRAQAEQLGLIQGNTGFAAILRLGSPDGPEVGAALFSFENQVQSAITATAMLSPTQLGPGRHLVYWDVSAGLNRPDPATPIAVSGANVLPDLMAHPTEIRFGGAVDATTPITLVVRNAGNWVSEGGRVAVYDRDPGAAGAAQLGTFPLPAIPPGQHAELAGSLNTVNPVAVYVVLDPDDVVDELNENNNIIVAGRLDGVSEPPLHRFYLPLILRSSQ